MRRELFGHRLRVRLASTPTVDALARVAALGLTNVATAGTTLVGEVWGVLVLLGVQCSIASESSRVGNDKMRMKDEGRALSNAV